MNIFLRCLFGFALVILFGACAVTNPGIARDDKKNDSTAAGASRDIKLQTTDTEASVQIYLPGLDLGMGTAMKVDTIPPVSFKSRDKKNFTFSGLNTVTLNEAIDDHGKIIAYLETDFRLKPENIQKLNAFVKNGEFVFQDAIDSLNEKDFEASTKGTREAPDLESFSKLRHVFVYNFIIKDSDGMTFPMQIIIETLENAPRD